MASRKGWDLYVADGAADFGDKDFAGRVGLADDVDAVLDFVGDVGDDLNGAAEVVAAALFVEYRPVDFAGRDVGVAGHGFVGEALIVTYVEVRLRAVVGDKDFTVLIGAHRAGVDVEVGIEFLDFDVDSAGFEHTSEGRCRDALAETADDSAGDENVFHNIPPKNCSLEFFHNNKNEPDATGTFMPHFRIIKNSYIILYLEIRVLSTVFSNNYLQNSLACLAVM